MSKPTRIYWRNIGGSVTSAFRRKFVYWLAGILFLLVTTSPILFAIARFLLQIFPYILAVGLVLALIAYVRVKTGK